MGMFKKIDPNKLKGKNPPTNPNQGVDYGTYEMEEESFNLLGANTDGEEQEATTPSAPVDPEEFFTQSKKSKGKKWLIALLIFIGFIAILVIVGSLQSKKPAQPVVTPEPTPEEIVIDTTPQPTEEDDYLVIKPEPIEEVDDPSLLEDPEYTPEGYNWYRNKIMGVQFYVPASLYVTERTDVQITLLRELSLTEQLYDPLLLPFTEPIPLVDLSLKDRANVQVQVFLIAKNKISTVSNGELLLLNKGYELEKTVKGDTHSVYVTEEQISEAGIELDPKPTAPVKLDLENYEYTLTEYGTPVEAYQYHVPFGLNNLVIVYSYYKDFENTFDLDTMLSYLLMSLGTVEIEQTDSVPSSEESE